VESGNDVGTHVGTLTRTKHQRAHVTCSLKNASMGVAESWRFIEDQSRALAVIRSQWITKRKMLFMFFL